MGEWINVKDSIPNEGQQVIALEGKYPPANEDISGAVFEDGKFWFDVPSSDYPSIIYASHWMPLPDPPND